MRRRHGRTLSRDDARHGMPEVVSGLDHACPNVHLDLGTDGVCVYCGRDIQGERGSSKGPTMGHLRPRRDHDLGRAFRGERYAALRHDPDLPYHRARFWVDQCRNCNKRQGNLTVRQFALWANQIGGGFGTSVDHVMGTLRDLGLLDNDF